MTFNIIWIAVLWIIWKERNGRIFQYKTRNSQALSENVNHQIFLVLKLSALTKLTQPPYASQYYHAGKLHEWTSIYPHKS